MFNQQTTQPRADHVVTAAPGRQPLTRRAVRRVASFGAVLAIVAGIAGGTASEASAGGIQVTFKDGSVADFNLLCHDYYGSRTLHQQFYASTSGIQLRVQFWVAPMTSSGQPGTWRWGTLSAWMQMGVGQTGHTDFTGFGTQPYSFYAAKVQFRKSINGVFQYSDWLWADAYQLDVSNIFGPYAFCYA